MTWWKWLILAWALLTVLFIILGWLRYSRIEREQEVGRAVAAKHGWWRWRWSQDGWVRKCKICGAIQYGGDDYDGGPNDGGRVVSAR